MRTNLILSVAISALLLPYIGVWALLNFGGELLKNANSTLIGAMVGSSLAVGSSAFIWLLTYWQKVSEAEKAKRNFRQALWTEISSLYGTAYDEAQWWKNEAAESRYGATEKRLLNHFQAGVLNANLARITDIKPRVADSLIALRAFTLILPEKIEFYYEVEDKILAGVKADCMTEVVAIEILTRNKKKMCDFLMRLAGGGRKCSQLLDQDGDFEEERARSFNPKHWALRKASDDEMNNELDELNVKLETRDPFSM
ncbi:hypothetical protein V6B08_19815 [Ferrovibrio sp. MS7]|uniref:hypothetical protein n=1 Tax=Ferrovibrio plantarum TaxID=3119164 RepID=UPI0031367B42